jgi:transmembrane sensor
MDITRALEWLVELEDQGVDLLSPYPTMGAKLQAFAQWFLESPQNQDAFMEAMAVSGISRRFDLQRRINVEHLKSAPLSNVVPFRGESPARCASEQPRGLPATPGRRRFLVAAACASALAVLAVPFVISALHEVTEVSSPSPVRYSAGIGERRFLPLEDGTTIELNTRSIVEVEFTSRTRRVTLLAGEAVFNVRHDEARPFEVVSGGLVIRDVGTTFGVRRSGEATTVSVLEGRVAISMAEAGKGAFLPTIVDAEHRAEITMSGKNVDLRVEPITATELARVLAWRDGHLVFRGETLAAATADFNRYHRRQIEIVDSSIARLQVGGTFSTTDSDAFLAALQVLFRLRTVPVAGNANALELKRQETQ